MIASPHIVMASKQLTNICRFDYINFHSETQNYHCNFKKKWIWRFEVERMALLFESFLYYCDLEEHQNIRMQTLGTKDPIFF